MSIGEAPANVDLSETKVPSMVGSMSSTWSLAVIAVGLRIASRRFCRNALWLDDWVICIALCFATGLMFEVTVWMVDHGFGKHIWVGPAEGSMVRAIGLFVAEITYTCALATVKWSILAFYWRIFSQTSIRIPIWILSAAVVCWAIAVIGVSIFQCYPVRAFWERFNPVNPMMPSEYHCGVNDNQFLDGNVVPNIITDVCILILPIPYVWKLYLPRAQKVATSSIFILGIFVTAVSIFRFTVVLDVNLQSPDITWNFVGTMMWTSIEANTAIVCACLPSLKPLLNLIIYRTFDPKSGKPSRENLPTPKPQK